MDHFPSSDYANLIYQVVPQHVVQALFAACKSGDFDSANKEVNNVIAEGYPVSQMLCQVQFWPFWLPIMLKC